MSTITTRAAKGSALSHDQVDSNFTNLNSDKYESGDSPSFSDITIDSNWKIDGQAEAGTERLRLQAVGANDPPELFLQSKGSASSARITVTADNSSTNFSGITMESNGTDVQLKSIAEGSATALPMTFTMDATESFKINTDASVTMEENVVFEKNADLNGAGTLVMDADGDSTISAKSDDVIKITTGSTQQLEIGSSYVEVTQGTLYLDGDVSGQVRIVGDTITNSIQLWTAGTPIATFNAAGNFVLSSGDVLVSSGNVGIGESSPSDILHITDTSLDANTYARFENDAETWQAGASGGNSDGFVINRIGSGEVDIIVDTNNKTNMITYGGKERSSDPGDPAEGEHTIWQSDGTETGVDGDILIKRTFAAATQTDYVPLSSATTGGTGSAGAGNQYVELEINGSVYKVLHDGTV